MRGRWVQLIWLLIILPLVANAFEFNDVRNRARDLSSQPYQLPDQHRLDVLTNLTYEQYQRVSFRGEKAFWRDEKLPFQLEFFHPGYRHQQVVGINEIGTFGVRKIEFRREYFRYPTNQIELPNNMGFAGFRIVHPRKDFGELAVFLDASYFRMIGKGQIYGTSGRGLALNTSKMADEEFPVFREFWVRKPKRSDDEITLYALLDSPSVAGAYEFVVRPDVDTVTTVRAAFFPRQEVKEFGIAPLTSMFLHGEGGPPPVLDFRPEVHDADGLLIHNFRNEWIWRPLEAGKMLRVNAYFDEALHGFGLIQRDRNYDHFQDPVARFEKRTSAWVRPIGDWGKGAIELVQLPSNIEYADNVVAFWVPSTPPAPGRGLDLMYELHWTHEDPSPRELASVQATRIGLVGVDPPRDPRALRFIIDFGGKAMDTLKQNEKLVAETWYGDGAKKLNEAVIRNDINQTWRLALEIEEPKKALDMRAFLKHRGKPITEVWTFTWQP